MSSITSGDLLFLFGAIALSVLLGGMHRLGRTLARQRRAVDLADHGLRELSSRCELQQAGMSRLTQEMNEMRQALMQQAMALAPVHAAMRVPVAVAPEPAPRPAAAPRAGKAAATGGTQRVAAARPTARLAGPRAASAAAPRAPGPAPADPHALARAGAGVDALVARCGLSRAEAELVVSVHGKAAGRTAA